MFWVFSEKRSPERSLLRIERLLTRDSFVSWFCLREVLVLVARSDGAQAKEGDVTVTDRSGVPEVTLGHAIVNCIFLMCLSSLVATKSAFPLYEGRCDRFSPVITSGRIGWR